MKPLGVEFRVGAFILIASGAIIAIFYFLNPESFQGGDYKKYYSVTSNAEGIVEKTHVRTNGVTVGRVAEIVLQTNTTKIIMEIRKGVDIPLGSVVEIRSRGLLGDKYIEIVRSASAEMAAEGTELESDKNSISPEKMMAHVGRVAQDIKKITGSLSDSITSEEGQDRIISIFENLEGLLVDLREVIGENRKDIAQTFDHLRDAASGIDGVVKGNVEKLDRMVSNLEDVSVALKEIVGEESQGKLSSILTQFDDSVANIKETTEHIKLVSARVEQGEGTLGKLISDDSTIEKIEEAIETVNEVLAPASKLQLEVDYHGEMRADDTTQHYFNLLFRTRPDKYYLFGVTDYGEQVVVTKKDTTPLEEEDIEQEYVTYETKTISDNKALRFNLQFAKRWYNVTLRFGLFESKGGVASDLHLLDDRLNFTFEAFDWSSEGDDVRKVAHFKAYAKMVFLKHLTLIAGIDDPTRIDANTSKIRDDLNYFFGAGFTFTDNDLKGFIGTAALAF